ncbi:hypothetical protein RFI_28537 [Reticulomyxa filosa]|uniref:Uncharacterized protein n=1 Tax=Reticulomyxa filosa TaxID=46433 RepID=X6M4K2_RETFI|nr:hypothetical protein RFI_28537 [Reticulomyxa filosa]|eukprot:ETO08849.1 hypothetical protein RFI_28537 [Reticulomyxa filosa]
MVEHGHYQTKESNENQMLGSWYIFSCIINSEHITCIYSILKRKKNKQIGKEATGPEWRYSHDNFFIVVSPFFFFFEYALFVDEESTHRKALMHKEKLIWNEEEDEEWEGTVKDELYNNSENAMTITQISELLEMTPGSKISWNEFTQNCGFDNDLNQPEILRCIFEYLPGVPVDWGREVHFQGCCALTGQGLWEGLVWLEEAILKFEKDKLLASETQAQPQL